MTQLGIRIESHRSRRCAFSNSTSKSGPNAIAGVRNPGSTAPSATRTAASTEVLAVIGQCLSRMLQDSDELLNKT